MLPTTEILTPSSRADWLAMRGQTLGASETAALFGAHPFLTAYELHHLKAGTIAADPTETGPMRRGRHLERVAIEFLREERPHWTVVANPIPGGRFYRDRAAGLSCTPDAFVIDPERGGTGICQIKSVEPSVFRARWRNEDGAVEPPLYVAIQAIQEAMLTGATWAIVCPLVVGFAIEMPVLEVPLHLGLVERLKGEAAAFWRDVSDGRPPAPDVQRDGALLEMLWTGSDPEIDLSGDNELPAIIAERERLSAEKGVAEKRLREIKSALVGKLGDAATARLADGRVLAARRIERKGYTVEPSSYVDLKVKGRAA